MAMPFFLKALLRLPIFLPPHSESLHFLHLIIKENVLKFCVLNSEL